MKIIIERILARKSGIAGKSYYEPGFQARNGDNPGDRNVYSGNTRDEALLGFVKANLSKLGIQIAYADLTKDKSP